jgi:tetratricopeptide (TPR) repeat protein
MSQENLVTCYEGIQRIYRNSLVRFFRSTMTQVFPTDSLEKLRSPFQKEWEKLKADATSSRASGELETAPADDFDLLSVNHFFNLFDAYYDELCVPLPSASDQDKKRQKQAFLNWVRTIKTLRDPLSHPSEQDFSTEDAFVLLDCARRVLLRVGLENEASDLRQLIRGLLGTAPDDAEHAETGPLDDRLPPKESIVVDFIGRQKELEVLWKWFADPVARRWALAGEGGKGKSALAYNFAFEVKVKAPQPFQTVVWLSAKRKQFVEGASVTITRPDFFDLDSALCSLLTHYGWLEEIKEPTESKRQRVLQLLAEFPALVVLDDIDSLEIENEDVIEFFSLHVPTTASKVLFTSRRTIFGLGGTTTHVGGLSDEDAIKFIASRCELLELDPTVFEKKIVNRILTITERSPLYIEDLMRLSATVNSANEALRLWAERGGAEARRYALGRECDLLSPEARTVLFAACISPGPVSFAELEAVTGYSAEFVTKALQELQRLFLVPKPRLIEGEQRFEVNVNTRTLVRDVYGSSDQYRRVDVAYQTIAKGVPENLRVMFLLKASNNTDAEQLLLKGLERHPSNPNLLGVLALVYKAWQPPRITDARDTFRRAWQLKCLRQETYQHWCEMELRQREWTKAVAAAESGLKILPDDRILTYLAGFARSRLARELKQGLHQEKAAEHIELAKRLLEKAIRLPADLDGDGGILDAKIYRSLVLTCELAGDLQAVRHYSRTWRVKHPNDRDAVTEWERISAKYHLYD